MKYILTPRNEGQEINCRISFNGTKAQAIQAALKMATNLQNALLNKADISVHIQTWSESLRGIEGQTLSLKTGDPA